MGHFYGYGIYGKGLIIVTDTGVFVMEQVFYYLLWVTYHYHGYGNRPTELITSHAFLVSDV